MNATYFLYDFNYNIFALSFGGCWLDNIKLPVERLQPQR